uniref:CX domain-containing protein n=1 Tax=Rhabditophanes sp. KR3021 TaxID=114890 RepID=A0AC35UGH4_9BILA
MTSEDMNVEELFDTLRKNHQWPFNPDLGIYTFKGGRNHPDAMSVGMDLIDSTKRVVLKTNPSAFYYNFSDSVSIDSFNQISDRICLTTTSPSNLLNNSQSLTEDIKLFFFCNGFCCETECCNMNSLLLTLLILFIALLVLICMALIMIWNQKSKAKLFDYGQVNGGYDEERFSEVQDDYYIDDNEAEGAIYYPSIYDQDNETNLHPKMTKIAVACKTNSIFAKANTVKTFIFSSGSSFGLGSHCNNDRMLLCEDEGLPDVMEMDDESLISEGTFV